ncbi:MAG: pyridoxal phosphate-dependent aminotransferase [Aeromicrobium sp.]|nr:pyridoxal phosphate-dependent aminotransferase [Aeromicrobium sp.]
MDARAKALAAAGRPVIGFGAGEPDFATPDHVVEAAAAACRDPRNHRYSPVAGLPELREAIARKSARDSGLIVANDQILVTNGGKQAVALAFAATIDPGDEVLLPAPYWTTYPEAIRLAGGVPVVVPTTAETGFKVTVEQLERYRTERTRMLVLCSPSNPTGAVYDERELESVGRWLVESRLWVLTDEIYEHFAYATAGVAPSLPVVAPEVRDRCIVVNGVAKSYAMTGWRVGWMIAPRDVTLAATTLQSHITSNVSNVAQRATIAALDGNLDSVTTMRRAFDRRRRLITTMLDGINGFECDLPGGAFYAFPSVHGLFGRSVNGRVLTSSADVVDVMLDHCEVAAVPGEAFGALGYVRFSYAIDEALISEGMQRLGAFFGRDAI